MGMEWQKGRIFGVFLAAMIAATSAAAMASPFCSRFARSRFIVLGFNRISPVANASLRTTSFGEISTMEKRRISVNL
jgi:hypothetical protein